MGAFFSPQAIFGQSAVQSKGECAACLAGRAVFHLTNVPSGAKGRFASRLSAGKPGGGSPRIMALMRMSRRQPGFSPACACQKGAPMEAYKQEFIEFMVESDVLKFGEFTLKSGRQSPFFMNAGAYVTGYQLKKLGEYYARAIHDNFGLDFDVLFGPAYKGIPLSVVTAIAMHDLYGKEVRYCSDRKEVKDHGADKGGMLGYELKDGDRVVMVEDVTTSGKSIDETYPKLMAAANVEVKGLIVSLNRMEVGKGGKVTAQQEIQERYGFPVASIVSMAEVVEHLHNREVGGRVVIDDAVKAAIDAYYEQYGVK